MNYKEKYTKETGRKPYCYNAKGEIVQSASYGDGYVKWLEKQLSLCSVVHSAYLCKNVNGEDCMVVAKNIADAFDKLEKITPCPEDVTVSGKSTRVYY